MRPETVPDTPTRPERNAVLAAYRDNPLDVARSWPLLAILRAEWPQSLEGLVADELLAALLETSPIHPMWLERRLTDLRRRFLLEGCDPAAEPLLGRLAIQCQLNDYVWSATADETVAVARLMARITTVNAGEAMIVACYAPLFSIPDAPALLARGWRGPVEAVLEEQIAAPAREAASQARIPTLTPIGDGVSASVRAQYEASPYPRWRRTVRIPVKATLFGWRVPARPTVLYAGCGTGKHVVHAGQRFADARILGVDLSRASLGYALRKTRESGFTNIGYAQADLLALASTGFEFDAIECAGVLHHMADPFEGLRVLVGRLRPGGAIKLGLYSRTARRPLAAAQDLARRHSPATIGLLRQEIAAAPEGDPLREAMRYGDFYAKASCRDLLMHVQEHQMTFADLRRMLAENGLAFLGFEATSDVLAGYRAENPDDPRGLDLDRWEAYEASHPEVFRQMYQFWAVKAG